VMLHIDFEGSMLTRMPANATADAVLTVDSNGEVLEKYLIRNEATGGWRFVVRLRRVDAGKPVELRTHLKSGNAILSEIWSYILPPE
jgi:glucans biosynthesis protein